MPHSFSTDVLYRGDLGKEATMLVLTRRIGETLLIGKDVTVTVLGVSRQQVRIGIRQTEASLYTAKSSTRR
jgi:hypothetical protein